MTPTINLRNLQQENGTLLLTKIMDNMAVEMNKFETKIIKPNKYK